MLFLIVGALLENGTYYYESARVHFWAGEGGLCEMLQEVASPTMLSDGSDFGAGKVLIVALDVATLLWVKLCCSLFGMHFGVMHVWTI